jgi:hypothetical protein
MGNTNPSSKDEGSYCCPKHTVTVVITMMLAFSALSSKVQMGCRLCKNLNIFLIKNKTYFMNKHFINKNNYNKIIN